jgi:hypothetical protein
MAALPRPTRGGGRGSLFFITVVADLQPRWISLFGDLRTLARRTVAHRTDARRTLARATRVRNKQ